MYMKSVLSSLSGNTQGKSIKASIFQMEVKMETQQQFVGKSQHIKPNMTYILLFPQTEKAQCLFISEVVPLPSLYTELMSDEKSLSSRPLSLGSELQGLT